MVEVMASSPKMDDSRKAEEPQKMEQPSTTGQTPAAWSTSDHKALLQENGYELLRKIGHGSFAKVWKSKSLKLKKDVAIKIISKPKASTEYVEKFLPRELAITQKLKHKNLVKFYEVIETWHSVYIIMELAEKGTIADLISKKKYIPENQARKYYLQLIDVIEYCHLNGIVHRDIKCENLLLNRENNLLLTDFGFAKQDVYPLSSGMFRPSKTYCGSYAYAPPEVLANKPYNPCLADVWCMGMVLYTMLFGVLPYKSQNMKTLIEVKSRPPNFPETPATSPRVKKFLLMMLATEAERADITQLRADKWLFAHQTPAVKRFSWLPGPMKSPAIDVEETSLSDYSTSTSTSGETLLVENKSITVDMSKLLEAKKPNEQSQDIISSASETTILTSRTSKGREKPFVTLSSHPNIE